MHKLLSILLLICAITACEKEEDPRDPVPVISVVGLSPSILTEYLDSLVITIDYEDGDGDLGGGPADEPNLFVVDRRINVPFEYRIGQLVPNNSAVPISGRFRVVIQNLFITDGSSQQQVDFEIFAQDRAGNESNRVVTQQILIVD